MDRIDVRRLVQEHFHLGRAVRRNRDDVVLPIAVDVAYRHLHAAREAGGVRHGPVGSEFRAGLRENADLGSAAAPGSCNYLVNTIAGQIASRYSDATRESSFVGYELRFHRPGVCIDNLDFLGYTRTLIHSNNNKAALVVAESQLDRDHHELSRREYAGLAS